MHKDCLKKSSRPKSPTARALDHLLVGGGHDHLEVPWEWLLDPKLKIYVETICCEHFVFHRAKFFVINFCNYVLWKLSIFWQFCINLFLVLSCQYSNKKSKIWFEIGIWSKFVLFDYIKNSVVQNCQKIDNFHKRKFQKLISKIFALWNTKCSQHMVST